MPTVKYTVNNLRMAKTDWQVISPKIFNKEWTLFDPSTPLIIKRQCIKSCFLDLSNRLLAPLMVVPYLAFHNERYNITSFSCK